ncbi:MAG: hypothetical protein VB092_00420 [Oscillospiraceae bacterium]|nr:hypothetical protein [Oscillospiraceae bacterium]
MKKEEIESRIQILTNKIVLINSNRMIQLQLSQLFSEEGKYKSIAKISPTFWSIVLQNIHSQILLGIAKIYDESKDCFGLQKLTAVCEQNAEEFPKERIHKYANLDGGAPYEERVLIDIHSVIADAKALYREVEEDRQRLKTFRDKNIAHIDKKYICNPSLVYQEFPLPWDKVDKLIDHAIQICNLFSGALTGCITSIQLLDADDVLYLLNIASVGEKHKIEERKVLIGK